MKKYLSIILVLVLALTLMGCSSSSNDTGGDATKAETENQETEKQEDATEPSDDETKEAKSDSEFPNKPIQIICPVKPGGDTDRNTRDLAIALEKILGVSVVVSNIDGGATVIAMQQALNANPDGYTLIVNGTDIFVPYMMGTTEITLDSFKTVGIPIMDNTTALVVHKDSGITNVDDLVAKAGTLEYGGKIGATNQICGIAMNEEWDADVKFMDVGNNAAKITALLAEQTDVINVSYSLITDYVENGDFVPIALLGSEKNELLDFPLASEQGYADIDFSKFFWVGAHPETPDEIIDILADAVQQASQDPEFVEKMEANYLTPTSLVKEEAQAIANAMYEETMLPYKEEFLAAQ